MSNCSGSCNLSGCPTCNAGFSAGEVGIILTIAVNCTPLPTNPIYLTDATSINLSVYYPNGLTETTLAMTSSVDGLSALRTTLATDFPYPGTYQLVLTATFTGGQTLISLPYNFIVGGVMPC